MNRTLQARDRLRAIRELAGLRRRLREANDKDSNETALRLAECAGQFAASGGVPAQVSAEEAIAVRKALNALEPHDLIEAGLQLSEVLASRDVLDAPDRETGDVVFAALEVRNRLALIQLGARILLNASCEFSDELKSSCASFDSLVDELLPILTRYNKRRLASLRPIAAEHRDEFPWFSTLSHVEEDAGMRIADVAELVAGSDSARAMFDRLVEAAQTVQVAKRIGTSLKADVRFQWHEAASSARSALDQGELVGGNELVLVRVRVPTEPGSVLLHVDAASGFDAQFDRPGAVLITSLPSNTSSERMKFRVNAGPKSWTADFVPALDGDDRVRIEIPRADLVLVVQLARRASQVGGH